MVNKISIYGSFVKYVPVKQRYWKWIYHRTGPLAGEKWYKRRVWRKTARLKKVPGKGRFDFHGSGRDLERTVAVGLRRVPIGYVDVSAREFLEHPEKYSTRGEWIEYSVES